MRQNMNTIKKDIYYVAETLPELIESVEKNYKIESKINEQFDKCKQIALIALMFIQKKSYMGLRKRTKLLLSKVIKILR